MVVWNEWCKRISAYFRQKKTGKTRRLLEQGARESVKGLPLKKLPIRSVGWGGIDCWVEDVLIVANMKQTNVSLIVFSAIFIFTGCTQRHSKLVSDKEEQKWNKAFDYFVQKSPQCPKRKHPLVEGQNYYDLFGGSCFECRQPLGITTTKVNKFLGTRKTTTAKTYTCSEGCSYNICEECAD